MQRRVGLTTGGGEMIDPLEPACRLALQDPRHTMLGLEQEAWLAREFGSARQHWTVLAQSLVFADIRDGTPERPRVYSDTWAGYPQARQRLLAAAAKYRIRNLVVASGDVHSFWVNEIPGPDSRPAGTEFVTSSIATQTNHRPGALNALNPHIRYHEGRHSGYVRFDLDTERLRADLIGVENIRDPASPRIELARFEVLSGSPQVRRLEVTPADTPR